MASKSVATDYGSELLIVARSAYRRSDWRTTYETFSRVDGLQTLATDDLAAFASSAWRQGHGSEAVRINERVHTLLVRTDPVQAALKAAELGLTWLARGHAAVARDWADRAGLLLAGTPENSAHGYLAYLRTVLAADTEAAGRLRGVADRTGDAALSALAGAAGGFVALSHHRDAEGYALLDAVLLPVLDERVPMEWAADVYRRALLLADTARRPAWSVSMQQWCDSTDAVIYRAIGEVLRAHIGAGARPVRVVELRRVVVEVDALVAGLVEDLLARPG